MHQTKRTLGESIVVSSPDGATSTASIFAGRDPAAPVLLVLPAMGIESRFYAGFAASLVEAGLNAAVLDLRGLGTSSERASRTVDFGYTTIALQDLPAAMRAVKDRFPRAPLFLLAHSLGGQVASLYLAHDPAADVRGLVLVASGTPWWRLWPVPVNALLYVLGGWGFPALARALGHFPGRHFSFAGREARGVISDWAHIVRTGRFAPERWEGPDPEEALARVTTPVFAVSLERDMFTPRRVVEHMLAKLAAAPIERFHYDYRSYGEPAVDHVRWPKHPRIIVERVVAWTAKVVEAGQPGRPLS